MKNFLRSVLFGCSLLAVALASSEVGAAVISTNTTTVGIYPLLPAGQYKISQLQISAGSQPVQIDVYDSVNTTNYTNLGYNSVISYATNIVTTTISPLNGSTNLLTNQGIFTLTVSNLANTNNPLPKQTFYAQANTLATYPVSLINVRGLMIYANTNASVTFTYKNGLN